MAETEESKEMRPNKFESTLTKKDDWVPMNWFDLPGLTQVDSSDQKRDEVAAHIRDVVTQRKLKLKPGVLSSICSYLVSND